MKCRVSEHFNGFPYFVTFFASFDLTGPVSSDPELLLIHWALTVISTLSEQLSQIVTKIASKYMGPINKHASQYSGDVVLDI